MNWYKKYSINKFSTYSPELGSLKSILEHGYSPLDFADKVKNFLEKNPQYPKPNIEFDEYSSWEYGEEWIENVASDEALKDFERFTQSVYEDIPTWDMPYNYFDLNETMLPRWQVHFTDNPYDIASEGFTKGHPEVEGVHLTTHYENRGRGPGFNFGYLANSRLPNKSNYGKHAVVFYSGGLDTYHAGDMESQTVFWGPYVDPRMIFPIYNDGGEWIVEAANGRVVYQADDINDVVNYVILNWRMLYDVKTKEKNKL